jgi:hypothetical protein
MKVVLTICVAVISLALLSFGNFQDRKVELLNDGNYLVRKGAPIQEKDAQQLFDLTRKSASETTVVHTTIWKHKDAARFKVDGVVRSKASAASETTIVHQTIWKHKDAARLTMNEKEIAQVQTIMAKYVK